MVAISETLHQEKKYNNCFHFFALWPSEWLESLTVNAKVATVPASSDTVESEGRQLKLF
jgi:hypothetical protein